MAISHRRRRRLESSSRLSSRRLQRDRSRPSQNRRSTLPEAPGSLRWSERCPRTSHELSVACTQLAAYRDTSKQASRGVGRCVAQGCPFPLRRVYRISHVRRAPAAAQNTSAYKSRLPQEPALPSACQWAARAAEAASTRAGATARRPAACCPSRLYWVIGTGTTAARTGTTGSSSDCGASPSTRTATLRSCSSRTTDGDGSRLRSLLC